MVTAHAGFFYEVNGRFGLDDVHAGAFAQELQQGAGIGRREHAADVKVVKFRVLHDELPLVVAIELLGDFGERCGFEHQLSLRPRDGPRDIRMLDRLATVSVTVICSPATSS